jgi:F-type H+-transporting ATPase subunit gamma
MQLIAGSKMRRAQQMVLAGRPYAEKLVQIIADLEAQPREEGASHPLLEHRQVKRIQVLHLTPDRGLCGGLHGNINRRVAQFILEKRPTPVSIIAVGRKGRDFMARSRQDLQAAFVNIGDRPAINDILPISQLILKNYIEGQVDEVYLAYPKFVSLVSQQPEIMKLLPVDPAKLPTESKVGYIYEPNPGAVLNALLPRFVEMEIYHAMLELSASEQSARMVAMRNATDNANELVDELTLDLNKVRQNAITSEILDIIGGAMALRS